MESGCLIVGLSIFAFFFFIFFILAYPGAFFLMIVSLYLASNPAFDPSTAGWLYWITENLFKVFGIAVLAWALALFRPTILAIRSKKWTKTIAKVIDLKFKSKTVQIKSYYLYGVESSEDCYETQYSQEILYEFEYGGKKFQGSRIGFTDIDPDATPVWGNGKFSEFRPPETIEVYFDPANPENSVIERPVVSAFQLMLPLIMTILLLVFLILFSPLFLEKMAIRLGL